MNRDFTDTKLVGDAELPPESSLLDFWRWGFADQCDDDLKGYFAESMVGTLIGLPMSTSRRVSWADSDLITASGTRIEVKASAYWQSWKLVNEDGTRKPMPPPVTPDAAAIRFGGLQARTSTGSTAAPTSEPRRFKSDIYVFCMHAQTDPSAWDAWALSHWEFYVMTREELAARRTGNSISLATLRKIRPAMSARAFQNHTRHLLEKSAASNPAMQRTAGRSDA